MIQKKYLGKYTVDWIIREIKKLGTITEVAKKIKQSGVKCSSWGINKFLKKQGLSPTSEIRGGGRFHERYKGKKDIRPVAAGDICSPDVKRIKLKGKRFVFTAAQNNTYVHEEFFKSLLNFCKRNKAQLIVSRFSYNKSGFQQVSKDSEDLWYDEKIKPYVLDKSASIADGLVFGGELDILPTAIDPLSGFGSYFGNNSGIVPHTKVAMQSQARMKGEPARFTYTTGAITLRNYIQRKSGQKAEFHHVYGALYVEVDKSGEWFARQLIADNKGEFYDLTTLYTRTGVHKGRAVEAVNYGDIHVEKADKTVADASWVRVNSMLNILRPKYQFIHDITDFTARNHHNINDPYFIAAKRFENKESVESDLNLSAEWLDKISKNSNVVVVESNHHEAFQRWLKEAKIHYDPINAEFFHEANARLFRAIRLKENFDVYEWALRRHRELGRVRFLSEDESFVICGSAGIECGIHGHQGINGARGSSKSFRAIGKRVNLGHSHSAGIIDGVYTAGVSASLDMGYNKGVSSWSNSHIVTYPNGKRCIITIKNGRWRAS